MNKADPGEIGVDEIACDRCRIPLGIRSCHPNKPAVQPTQVQRARAEVYLRGSRQSVNPSAESLGIAVGG
mgnify:FL=1